MSVHVFGIRHHGPGCARSLRAALEVLEPDAVLVEGPPDAQEALPLLLHEEMQPPVALLVYNPEAPRQAAFYPFTHYSPEWQALRYALGRGILARFIDLPQAIQFALSDQPSADGDQPPTPDASNSSDGTAPDSVDNGDAEAPAQGPGAEALADEPALRDDPIGLLAEAAGYGDHELWWEHQIEQRQDATGLFEGILEAMTALRAAFDEPARAARQGQAAAPARAAAQGAEALREGRREAQMRQAIRVAQKDGFERIAVVCGAWHAPVLAASTPAKKDAALLAGLRRVKTAATWIPWTNGRLSYRSGYGAGVRSPGWYEHLWSVFGLPPRQGPIRWVARAAQLLRGEDLDASASNVIEAVRLADALAALRGLPMPGLAELHEAMQTVLCAGDPAPMVLIRDRLEIGERLGEVPGETPAVPLQRDLAMQQRRLRLKPSAEEQTLDLDLRNETDRARSHLLHRLRLLGIPWGHPQQVGGKSGTFHELWRLKWEAEFAVALIEANVWGNTIAGAATARACHDGEAAGELPRLTELLDRVILAALPEAVTHLLARVREQAAVAADVRHLMGALPPLARVARYGDVRETRSEEIAPVVDALFERIVVGLPGACSSLDDGAAKEMVTGMGQVQESVDLLDRVDERAEWQGTLRRLVDGDGVHGLVRGWACRLLLEAGALDAAELQRLARLALSPVTPAPQAAAWIEGVLRGSGFVLLQQEGLWLALDAWLSELAPETFTETLPLLRRAFAGFQAAERRTMGQKVKGLRSQDVRGAHAGPGGRGTGMEGIDRARAELVLPVLAQILGVELEGTSDD